MPVFIIKGADASANNLGQVPIPIDWDSDALAYRTAISAVSNNFDYSKNRALNTFFEQLKSNGIWSKINHIYLPLIGRVEGGVNLKQPSYNIGFPSTSTTATYDSNGVLFLLGWNTPFTVDKNLIHGGFYNTTTNSENVNFRCGIGNNSSNGIMFVCRRTFTGNTGVAFNSQYTAQRSGHINSIGPLIGNYDSANKYVSCLIDTEWAEQTRTEVAPITSVSPFTLGAGGNGSAINALNSSVGLFTFGTLLNQIETTIYGSLITDLITALQTI